MFIKDYRSMNLRTHFEAYPCYMFNVQVFSVIVVLKMYITVLLLSKIAVPEVEIRTEFFLL